MFLPPGNYATNTQVAGYFRNVALGLICRRQVYPAGGFEGVNSEWYLQSLKGYGLMVVSSLGYFQSATSDQLQCKFSFVICKRIKCVAVMVRDRVRVRIMD